MSVNVYPNLIGLVTDVPEAGLSSFRVAFVESPRPARHAADGSGVGLGTAVGVMGVAVGPAASTVELLALELEELPPQAVKNTDPAMSTRAAFKQKGDIYPPQSSNALESMRVSVGRKNGRGVWREQW